MLRTTQEHMEDHRLLASAALFRQLHENKKDVYDVLAQFIRSSINLNSLWSFNVTDCSTRLQKDFGFKIPDAVIRTCLNKRLKREGELSLHQGMYTISEAFVRVDSLKSNYAAIQSEQDFIIGHLITYVESSTKKKLTENERESLSADFHSYFLGGLQPCKNSLLISEFIVKSSADPDFTDKLNRLEEGLILYEGICHSSNLANHQSWRNNFTIFLDTEVLFYSQGFNGTLHKSIFDDFHALIKEVNTRTKNNARIELRFFSETRREIEDFFYAAEKIVEQRQMPDPSKPAMLKITNGCQNASDVVLKKANFYEALRKLRIEEEVGQNYYEPPTYVIDDAHTLKLLSEEHPELDQGKIADVLRLFTKINYLRRGSNNQGLEQSSAILVSGKNLTRILAFSKPIFLEPKQIPFATDLDYLTERLWLKLNKGFSDGKLPTSFDVVARAQVILSSQAGSKVAEDYKSLLRQVKSGDMSNESAAYLLSELRARTTKPEDFRPDTIEELAIFLRSEFLENAMREKTALQQKAEAGEKSLTQVVLLEGELKEKDDQSKQQEELHRKKIHQMHNKYQTEIRGRDIQLHKERIKPLRSAAKREFVIFLTLTYSLAIIMASAFIFALRNNDDTNLTIAGIALSIIPLAIMLIKVSNISTHLARKAKSRYLQRLRRNLKIPQLASYPQGQPTIGS